MTGPDHGGDPSSSSTIARSTSFDTVAAGTMAAGTMAAGTMATGTARPHPPAKHRRDLVAAWTGPGDRLTTR